MGSSSSKIPNLPVTSIAGQVNNASRGAFVYSKPLNITSTSQSSSAITSAPVPWDGVCIWANFGLPDIGCTGSNIHTTIDALASVPPLGDQCVLWNSFCSGNKSLAIEQFFNYTKPALPFNSCFVDPTQERCIKYEGADRIAEFEAIANWMRTPECWNDLLDYDRRHGLQPPNMTSMNYCCETCHLHAENVDIFYWPEPEVDTSCMSIVGEKALPIDYGGTTNQYGGVYWGCITSDIRHGIQSITTATITTMGSLSIKQTIIDPWGPQPCPTEVDLPFVSSMSSGSRPSLLARAHSLVAPSSITSNGGLPLTTVVLDGFTL